MYVLALSDQTYFADSQTSAQKLPAMGVAVLA